MEDSSQSPWKKDIEQKDEKKYDNKNEYSKHNSQSFFEG